jgi:hypothetical protein
MFHFIRGSVRVKRIKNCGTRRKTNRGCPSPPSGALMDAPSAGFDDWGTLFVGRIGLFLIA